MRKLIYLILFLALMLSGCSSREQLNETRLVQIKSVPEGAPIIVNGLNLGAAPLSVEFESNEFGCFVKSASITALPQKSDLNTQIISFPAYNQNNPEKSLIPESIVFNMFKSPAEANSVETNK